MRGKILPFRAKPRWGGLPPMNLRHAKKIAALIIAVAVILFPQLNLGDEYNGKVIGITDGDTLTLLVEGQQQVKIRLAEIDAPESGQPFGSRAKQELSSLAFDKDALVRVKDTDKYGRKVAHVLVDGVDVNAEMIKRGAAWVYRDYAWDAALYWVEMKAKRDGLGLWALPESEQIPPWEWRHRQKPVGNK